MKTCSIFAVVAPAGHSAHAAGECARRSFAAALPHELAGSSVGMTLVYPGGLRSPIAAPARLGAGIHSAAAARRCPRAEVLLRMPARCAATRIPAGIAAQRARFSLGGNARALDSLQRLAPARYGEALPGPLARAAATTRSRRSGDG